MIYTYNKKTNSLKEQQMGKNHEFQRYFNPVSPACLWTNFDPTSGGRKRIEGKSAYYKHFYKFENHRRIQGIEYGVHKMQNKLWLAATIAKVDETYPWIMAVRWNKAVIMTFFIHKRSQGAENGRWRKPHILGYLNPLMMGTLFKNRMCE